MSQPHATPPKSLDVWATRVYDRSPELKLYNSKGAAHASISYGMVSMTNPVTGDYETVAREGEVWHLTDSGWELEFHIPFGATVFISELPWKRK